MQVARQPEQGSDDVAEAAHLGHDANFAGDANLMDADWPHLPEIPATAGLDEGQARMDVVAAACATAVATGQPLCAASGGRHDVAAAAFAPLQEDAPASSSPDSKRCSHGHDSTHCTDKASAGRSALTASLPALNVPSKATLEKLKELRHVRTAAVVTEIDADHETTNSGASLQSFADSPRPEASQRDSSAEEEYLPGDWCCDAQGAVRCSALRVRLCSNPSAVPRAWWHRAWVCMTESARVLTLAIILSTLQGTDALVSQLEDLLRDRGGAATAYELFDSVVNGTYQHVHDAADAESAILQAELLHSILAQREATERLETEAGKQPKKGSMEWYRQHKDEVIATGSTVTIFQAAYCCLRIKWEGTMTDRSIGKMICFLSAGGQHHAWVRCAVGLRRQPFNSAVPFRFVALDMCLDAVGCSKALALHLKGSPRADAGL